jgi:hypothetical protein
MGLFSAIAGIGSALLGAGSSRRAARAQRAALAAARTQLNPFSVNLPGGAGGGFTPGVGQGAGRLDVRLGDLGSFRDMLLEAAGSFGSEALEGPDLRRLFGAQGALGDIAGVLPETTDLARLRDIPELGMLGSSLPFFEQGAADVFAQGPGRVPRNFADPYLRALQGAAGGAVGRAVEGLGTAGSGAGDLRSTAFRGAARQAEAAGAGFPDVFDRTLSTLRAQAEPFETRALQNLQQQLFNTGQLGGTGGGLQLEAFARGLGQADLGRQLSALGEARAAQESAAGVASGLAGIGGNVADLDDRLLSSAFSRFGQVTGLASDLANTRLRNQLDLAREQFGRFLSSGQFGADLGRTQIGQLFDLARFGQGTEQQDFLNQLGLNQELFNRGQTLLGNELGLASLPGTLRGQSLQQMLASLGGVDAIQASVLAPLRLALQGEQAAANARIGSAGVQAGIVTSPQFTAGQLAPAAALGELGRVLGGLGGNRGLAGIFGRIFGGGG